MRYLIAGDFHGRSLEKLKDLEFDILLCTGDFDRPDVIKEFTELSEELEAEGKEVHTVPGNHDDAVFRGLPIRSSTLKQQDETITDLHTELEERPEEREFIRSILEQKKVGLSIDNLDTVLLHGGLEGDLRSYPDCPPDKEIFWRRLRSDENYIRNFEEMESHGYRLMIRGHDHVPEYAYKDDNDIEVLTPEENSEYILTDDKSHTVTHGAWFEGWYVTIDTDPANPILKYHRVEESY